MTTPPVSDTPIYDQLMGELLTDPVKLAAEAKAEIAAELAPQTAAEMPAAQPPAASPPAPLEEAPTTEMPLATARRSTS